jgi:hypothetical protein
MTKQARSFRLSAEALQHLDTVQGLTGSSQAAILEQALALYRIFYDRDRDFVKKLLTTQPKGNR